MKKLMLLMLGAVLLVSCGRKVSRKSESEVSIKGLSNNCDQKVCNVVVENRSPLTLSFSSNTNDAPFYIYDENQRFIIDTLNCYEGNCSLNNYYSNNTIVEKTNAGHYIIRVVVDGAYFNNDDKITIE